MTWTWQWPDCPNGPLSQDDAVVVFKVKEEWGALSNMSNDYPLLVNGIRIASSEALYQACRFPHQPDWQEEILAAPHAMAAKMASKKNGRRRNASRPDFDSIRVDIAGEMVIKAAVW
jgi:type I restriction enzyme S subunit